MIDTNDILRNPVSRRDFLARMAAAGLGAAVMSLIAGCGGTGHMNRSGSIVADPANFPGITGQNENIVVLNYALTLEELEADLYRQALNLAAGKPITTPLPSDTSGYTLAISPGSLSPQNAQIGFQYLQQYAGVEAAHRDFLLTAIPSLGGTPVQPDPRGYVFPAGSSHDLGSILTIIRAVEETGVRAYLGAAGFLTDLALIQIASTIYSTEARHSAGMNYVLGLDTGPQPQPGDNTINPPGQYPSPNTFEYYLTPKQVLAAARPFFA